MAGDQYWYNKVLGLHCDGTNGSTTITDVKGKTVTVNGSPAITTAQYPSLTGKTSSLRISGAYNYLTVPNSSGFEFGSGDFTVRLWVRVDNLSQTNPSYLIHRGTATGYTAWAISCVGGKFSTYGCSSGPSVIWNLSSTNTFSSNTWYLVEVSRNGTTITLRVNGVTEGTATGATAALIAESGTVKIGAEQTFYVYPFSGYMAEIEVFKGACVNTSDYTPSSAPFLDEYVSVSGTVKDSSGNYASRLVRVSRRDTGALLATLVSNQTTGAWKQEAANTAAVVTKHCAVLYDIHPSRYMVLGLHCDGTNGSTTFSEVTGKTVTAGGNAQISTAQSKFGGASGYFDGTGDYLSLADSTDWDFGTGDFTVRCWVRLGSTGTVQTFLSNYQTTTVGWTFRYKGDTTTLQFLNGTTVLLGATWAPSADTWYLVEVSRISGYLRMFVDGTQLGVSQSNTTDITGSTSSLYIGAQDASNTTPLNGYLDDIEIYKGVGLNNYGYTVPTSAFTYSPIATPENALVYDNITPV